MKITLYLSGLAIWATTGIYIAELYILNQHHSGRGRFVYVPTAPKLSIYELRHPRPARRCPRHRHGPTILIVCPQPTDVRSTTPIAIRLFQRLAYCRSRDIFRLGMAVVNILFATDPI